mmetsp:Transcript_73157/g.211698  ORF Transcript_73157/g.211698 Transcript_73157/m.211698 type:complete len:201 (+) Transcript_73157:956-1558(+)
MRCCAAHPLETRPSLRRRRVQPAVASWRPGLRERWTGAHPTVAPVTLSVARSRASSPGHRAAARTAKIARTATSAGGGSLARNSGAGGVVRLESSGPLLHADMGPAAQLARTPRAAQLLPLGGRVAPRGLGAEIGSRGYFQCGVTIRDGQLYSAQAECITHTHTYTHRSHGPQLWALAHPADPSAVAGAARRRGRGRRRP